MIKSNSKQAITAIRSYIMRAVDTEGYDTPTDTNNYNQVCKFILKCFREQKPYSFNRGYGTMQDLFTDWCAGLPSCFDTSYYYNVSAVDLLGNWLQETETEKEKYTEQQAEKMVTALIYRELLKGDR